MKKLFIFLSLATLSIASFSQATMGRARAKVIGHYQRFPASATWDSLMNSITITPTDGTPITSSTGWLRGGNSGTTPGTDFLGTTDAQALAFKTNSTQVGRFLNGGGLIVGSATSMPFDELFSVQGTNTVSVGIAVKNLSNGTSAFTASRLYNDAGNYMQLFITSSTHSVIVGGEATSGNNLTGIMSVGSAFNFISLSGATFNWYVNGGGTAEKKMVLNSSGHLTIEGVTSTGATGSGKFVYDLSPALTGSPTAPTQSAGDNSTKLATTAYVDGNYARIAAKNFLTAQTASVTVTSFANPASDNTYLIQGYLNVTAISVDQLGFQVVFTDETNTVITKSLGGATAVSHTYFTPTTIRVKASTTITLSVIETISGGSETYNVGGTIIQE